MNIQGLQLLPDEALRHFPAQVLHQEPHTAVLQEYTLLVKQRRYK
jgi:hypothetical protein